MNISKKIVSFLVSCLILVSVIFNFSSVNTLKKSQVENLDLFRKEFLELGRESFNKSSNLFFNSLNVQNKIKKNNQSARESVISNIKDINPEEGDVIIFDIKTKQFIEGYNSKEITNIFDPSILDGYIHENILNQKIDFDLDNFNDFSLDKTNSIIPSKIHFRIYNDADVIIGFGQKFLTGKVRIAFIERQNEVLFRSQLYLSVIIFSSILAFISFFMVMFMQKIVIRPLKKIVEVVQFITGGNLNKQVEITSKDEIGQLGMAFNKMTNRLRESYTSLEGKIKERTKELEDERGSLENKVKERTIELESMKNDLEKTVLERTDKLNTKLAEVEQMNKLMANRELKMIELKKEIANLEDQLKSCK
jgi:methyl-accepting chemotaxis protein